MYQNINCFPAIIWKENKIKWKHLWGRCIFKTSLQAAFNIAFNWTADIWEYLL